MIGEAVQSPDPEAMKEDLGLGRRLSGFMRCRWPLVAAVLFALYGWQMARGEWVHDFWEYGAAVKELMRDIGSPRHPLLPLDAPHFSYSPYLVSAAWLGRLAGGAPVAVLAWAGLFNLGLILAGLRLFIAGTGCPRPRAATFYALVLWLLLWGAGAWQYSAFYHLGVLFWVLPYPSSFAFGLSWLILWQHLKKPTAIRTAAMGLLTAAVALTHPVTFLFLSASLAGLVFQGGRFDGRKALQAAAVLGIALAVAGFWPYFPFWQIAFGDNSAAYVASDSSMYDHWFVRTWPVWVCLPLLALGPGKGRGAGLGVAMALLAVLYALGWLTGTWYVGRVISHVALLGQLLLALRMASWEWAAFQSGYFGIRRWSSAAAIGFVLALGLIGSRSALLDRIALMVNSSVPAYRAYESLSGYLAPDDVVISDRLTANMIPTFGGKVMCPRFHQFFISDLEARNRDLKRLYEENAGIEVWKEVVARWGVTCILVSRDARFSERMALVSQLGKTVFEREEYSLVRISPEVAP